MAEDESDYVDCCKDEAASVASTVSWNTFLSRTNISSLTHAVFSEQETQFLHGLDDVIRAVAALGLRQYRYEEIAREEKVGEGETYIVERCVVAGQVLAVKHLKTSSALGDDTSRRRLRAVILELQIMRHRPLRNHPNFPLAFGYGWNMNDTQIMPYILVQYAPKGTLRQHLKSMTSRVSRRDVQIFAGDVASALSALHRCGIVHGDVKLDNVLVVHSWDRPAQVIAKLTDFGHALVVNDRSSKHGGTLQYGGTFMYNAPEVHDQDIFPIHRAAMQQCDIWAFGLLLWELCLQGEDHLSYSKRRWPETEHQMTDQRLDPADVRRYALASVPGKIDYILIRATMHRTLQEDPTNRITHLEDLPLLTEWNDIGINGLESELALHLESPSLTYEMFRPENGREIPWKHEEQIFQGLKRAQAKKGTKNNSSISWQLAICHHVGFGTPRSPTSAFQYAKVAQEEGHTVAAVFASLLCPNPTASPEPYVKKISTLFRSSTQSRGLPPVIQACFDNDSNTLISLLSQQQDPNSSTVDGCTMFHWFFMLEDPEAIVETLESMYKEPVRLHASLPFSCLRKAHDQWPLQLLGTPLGTAISVNSLPTVKALLALGANPLDHVYRSEDFPAGDPRVSWTALHLSSKYHCSEILQYLLLLVPESSLSALCPLASALPFSTSLERLAMHGIHRQEELDKTIDAIRSVQNLQTSSLSGMTALTQAIDFQDYDVVAALLRAEPELASRPLASVENSAVFNLPIHLAAQLAARRDVPEALSILQLINSYTKDLNANTTSSRDHLGMTPLHLAVTGPSCRATRWILEQCISLLDLEDNLGRTALHGCASDDNLEVLLIKGSAINQTDRYGMTALHRACIRGELGLVRCLLKHSPPLDLMNNIYGTPLHCAVINGSVDVVRALLEAGAPLNTQDCKGNTPVHVAVRMGRYMILRNLLDKGGSRSIQNVNGRTPEDLASSIGTTHSIATLHVLQGHRIGRQAEAATYFFSENDTDVNYMFHAQIRDQRIRDRNNPDFAWDANDGAPKVFSESYNSGQEEADPIGDEEQPALLDGRKEKKNKLQDIVAAINDAYYGISSSLKDGFAPYLHALIIPYLDDSVWQHDEPSPIPIGRVLAVTAFRLGMIMKMLEEGHWPNRLASNNLTRAPVSWATPIGNQGDGAEKKTQEAANKEAEDERNSSVTKDSLEAGKETQDGPLIKDKEEARSKNFQYSKEAKFLRIGPFSAWKDKQDNPPAYLCLEDNMRVAVDQIIKMVEQTKPAWALPAWSQWHFKTTITWEVNRIQTASDASYLDTLLADEAGSMDQSLQISWTMKDQKPTRIQLQQYK